MSDDRPDHDQPDHDRPDHDQPAHSGRSRPDQPRQPASRRTLLQAAGLVALTGGGTAVLSACSAEGGTARAPSTSVATSSAPASTAAAPSPSEAASATRSATTKPTTEQALDGPSVATSKVPVGSGVILDDADYVVTQPTTGDFKAFSKICTHMRCPVTEIAGGNIVCKCHGSQFSIRDGSVTNPPASRPLAEAKLRVFEGKAYITG